MLSMFNEQEHALRESEHSDWSWQLYCFWRPKRRNVSLLSFMNDRKDADMYYGWQKELIGRGNC